MKLLLLTSKITRKRLLKYIYICLFHQKMEKYTRLYYFKWSQKLGYFINVLYETQLISFHGKEAESLASIYATTTSKI